jgi:iron complex outermembrane receptor protein
VTPLPSLAGALPVVTDQYATVTAIPNEELRRTPSSTLGDLLFSKPGITGSSFAPGAASRPIIRGLDGNRVGIVENGVGAGGVSDLGEDHFVPVTPLMSEQVEVIRGPATLRYGSQSIGGVVSSTNNRIPDRLPCGAPCARFETRGAATTVDNGLEGGVLADAAVGNVAIHADAFGRKAGDYRIPGYPYLFESGRPFNGKQPNSSARTESGSIGASYILDQGFIGAAVTQNNALYRIPASTAKTIGPASTRAKRRSPARASTVRKRTGSMPRGSGTATPTTSTTSSGLRIRSMRRATACARPSPTTSMTAASNCN